jgi:CPA1 family monovalent cation:H+ antiporter
VEASGVLAVVVAGLVTGTMGPKRFSARDRQTQTTTWTTINFILESALFLAMGYQLTDLIDDASNETTASEVFALVAVVTGLLVVIRALGMLWPWFGSRQDREARAADQHSRFQAFEEKLGTLDPGKGRGPDRIEMARHRLAQGRADLAFELREPVTAKGLLVLAWAGMRGVVTVAAVQTIPLGTPHRDTVVLAAYLVALITLIVFGLTLPVVIEKMHFPTEDDADRRDAVGELMSRIGAEAIDVLGPLEEQRIDGEPLDPAVVVSLQEQVLPRLVAGQSAAREVAPDTVEQSLVIQQRYLDAMREALDDERRIGVYSTATYRSVQSMLDMFEGRFQPPR